MILGGPQWKRGLQPATAVSVPRTEQPSKDWELHLRVAVGFEKPLRALGNTACGTQMAEVLDRDRGQYTTVQQKPDGQAQGAEKTCLRSGGLSI